MRKRVETVRRWVEQDFALRLTRLDPVEGGLDRSAAVWRGVDDHDRAWAVKWTRRDTRYGLLLAQTLSAAGTPGVPSQLAAETGRPWSDRKGGRLAVTAWVDGREAFEGGLSGDEWCRFGRLLRRIHDTPAPAPESAPSDSPARRGIRRAGSRIPKRMARIDEIVRARSWPDDDALAARTAADWPDLRMRIEAFRAAARRLRVDRAPAVRVSCHGDPHLGNVLVDDQGQPWLIDFDDAVEAPREVDLMLIELGVLFALPATDDDRMAFHDGYGPMRIDQDRLLRFGCVRAVEDLVDTILAILSPDTGTPGADLQTMLDGILSPTGLAGKIEARLRHG